MVSSCQVNEPGPAEVMTMGEEIKDEWIISEENDPPPDLSRESAAFERERARLVRDHLGKYVLIRFDDIVGVYDTPSEAMIDAYNRFGYNSRRIIRPITEKDEPEWI